MVIGHFGFVGKRGQKNHMIIMKSLFSEKLRFSDRFWVWTVVQTVHVEIKLRFQISSA